MYAKILHKHRKNMYRRKAYSRENFEISLYLTYRLYYKLQTYAYILFCEIIRI